MKNIIKNIFNKHCETTMSNDDLQNTIDNDPYQVQLEPKIKFPENFTYNYTQEEFDLIFKHLQPGVKFREDFEYIGTIINSFVDNISVYYVYKIYSKSKKHWYYHVKMFMN